jgi:hypothetical protein
MLSAPFLRAPGVFRGGRRSAGGDGARATERAWRQSTALLESSREPIVRDQGYDTIMLRRSL